MRGHVVLSHGAGTGPQAAKVSALAALAESLGWRTHRPDYRADDALGLAGSVAPRLARLRDTIAALDAPPLLVGSSMGAFVSALASLAVPVAGLLLLATPAAIPGCAQALDLRPGVPAVLVHGWRDDTCPADAVQTFAAARRLPLLMLDDDHRLGASLPAIEAQLRQLLDVVAVAA